VHFETLRVPIISIAPDYQITTSFQLDKLNKRRHLFLLASCSGAGSVDTSAVTLATVCGDPSLGVLVELFGFSFSSTGEVLGFVEELSFDTAEDLESSLTAFSTPFGTIFSTGVADPLARLRERFTSFA